MPARKPEVEPDEQPTNEPVPDEQPGQAEAPGEAPAGDTRHAVEIVNERGYHGERPDDTPLEAYTVAGVTGSTVDPSEGDEPTES